MSTSSNSTKKSAHLFVLVHGLWGGAGHLKSIEHLLKSVLTEDELISDTILTIKPKTSALLKTYDGISVIADRMLTEIFTYISDIKRKSEFDIKKISFVGYSLGGLVARHLIGQLERYGFFESVEPYYYTSFASPHLGTWFFDYPRVNDIGSKLIGRVGSELFVADENLSLLKLSEGDFIKGLKRFKKRFAFANIRHDRSVAFYTSYITEYSPFETNWNKIKLIHEKGSIIEINGKVSRPVFVDFLKTRLKTEQELKHDHPYSLKRCAQKSVIIIAVVSILPFWFPVILMVTIWGTVLSHGKYYLFPYSPTDEDRRQQVLQLEFKVDEQGVVGRLSTSNSLISTKYNVDKALDSTGNVEIRGLNILREQTEETTEGLLESAINVNEFNCRCSLPEETNNIKNDPDIIFKDGNPSIRNQHSGFKDLSKFVNPDLSETGLVNEQRDMIKEVKAITKGEKIKELNSIKNPSLSQDGVKLNLGKIRGQICQNLNTLSWYKFAVDLDVLNAHNSIVARRGLANASPQGLNVLLSWCQMIRKELNDELSQVEKSFA